MPEFTYEAFDPRTGKHIKESAEFSSVLELFQRLQDRGIILIKYKQKRSWGLRGLSFSRVSRRELAEFCRNLAFMLRGGVPILHALADLEKATENKSLAKAIRKLRSYVEEGRSFSEGLETTENVFSPIVKALTLVGEESGKLPETLEAASEHLLRVDEIISNTKRALIYPTFVFISMTAALAFWIFFVLPRILSLFQEMNTELPLATKVLIKIVSFSAANWPYFSLPPLLIALGTILVIKNEKCKFFWEKFSLKIPLLKKIKRYSLLAFFFEYIALLLYSGISLMRSLEIMQKSFKSPYFFQILELIKKRIEEGYSFTRACEVSSFFSHLELRMIKVGEETGNLVEQLRYLADYYYQGLEHLVTALSKIIEPMLIIIAGLMFLIIALALIGPIYDLVSQIGAG
ncbi:type II secretion system F family protein [Thermodesulfatator atlanticus]|uniref:type II secretion system F family protein n=1 Tax=Thermodesulfatator atlanticus TaxID=501497 RepID=UPI0003B77BDA|nr:type II secretion system F family protein [Thermodesulfatator atlanticus]